MSEQIHVRGILPKEEASPLKKNIWRVIKLTLFLSIFLFVIATVLTKIGGSSPTLRSALEDLLTEKTGYSAHILRLNDMSFFPDMNIDVEGLEFRTKAAGESVANIGSAHLTLGFFDVIANKGKVKVFDLEQVVINPGILSSQAIKIKSAALKDDPENNEQASLEVKGFWGEAPFEARITVKAEGASGHKSYVFGKERDLEAKIGGIEASAQTSSNAKDGMVFDSLKLLHQGQEVLNGRLTVKYDTQKTWSVGGSVILQPGQTELNPNINIITGDAMSVEGDIALENVNARDLADNSPVMEMLNELQKIFNGESNENQSLFNFIMSQLKQQSPENAQ